MQTQIDFQREGTHEFSLPDGPTIRARTALTRTVSTEDVHTLNNELRAEGLDPDDELHGVFREKYDIDIKQLDFIRQEDPELHKRICRIVTSKPRAIALTIKDMN